MSHLKKDFKFHNYFDNKFCEQTYLAYLCRDKKRYVIRSGAIARRGSVQNAIDNIKQLYIKSGRYYYSFNRNVSLYNVYTGVNKDVLTNEYINKVYQKLEILVSWQDKFESDFEGFKDYIYDEMQEIDNEHYCWVMGENIIYDRSIVDNIKKRVHCSLNNDKVILKFKKIYFDNVFIESKYKATLYNQISYLLISIADVNNYLITKENAKAIELLQDYFDDNKNMANCRDIYYLKEYYKLHQVYNLLSQGKNHKGLTLIQEIIERENNKYISSFTLFESVAIDIQESTYSKIINI